MNTQQITDLFYNAVIDTRHEIEAGQVILKYDANIKGKNALNQLALRIEKAAIQIYNKFNQPEQSPEIERPAKLNEFHKHIILYAKEWYRRSENVLEDLKTICAKIAEIDAGDYRDEDAYYFVTVVFMEYCSEFQKLEVLRRFFRPYGENFKKDCLFAHALVSMLGAIAVVSVKGNPKLEGLLGKPDSAILPLSRP